MIFRHTFVANAYIFLIFYFYMGQFLQDGNFGHLIYVLVELYCGQS